MIGIYCIEHADSGKKYIGKARDIARRIAVHKYHLTRPIPDQKHVNRYLRSAVEKYGWDAFTVSVIESFAEISDDALATRELHWMDHFDTCQTGYNLRRDSSSGMIVHPDTSRLKSDVVRGEQNPNFGNTWNDVQRARMREIAKARHGSGAFYDAAWRAKLSVSSSEKWKNETLKSRMAAKVSRSKMKFDFHQFDTSGNLIRVWSSVTEIVAANPDYKWQNIYSVCNGYKPTYRGFIWKKVLKNDN